MTPDTEHTTSKPRNLFSYVRVFQNQPPTPVRNSKYLALPPTHPLYPYLYNSYKLPIKIYIVMKLKLVLRKELVCEVYLSYSVITLDMYEEHAWNKTGHFYILYMLQIQQDLDLHKFWWLVHSYTCTNLHA